LKWVFIISGLKPIKKENEIHEFKIACANIGAIGGTGQGSNC
jgi:hypothetical protein